MTQNACSPCHLKVSHAQGLQCRLTLSQDPLPKSHAIHQRRPL